MSLSANRYFHRVKIIKRTNGERLPLVFDDCGLPSYFPTCFLLGRRQRSVASSTLESNACDLLHLGQILIYERLEDLHHRLATGHYLTQDEVSAIVSACGISTKTLKSVNDPQVLVARPKRIFGKADSVTNSFKHRRITNVAKYIDMVARMAEASLDDKSEQRRLTTERQKILDQFEVSRPMVRSSRVRNKLKHTDLQKVVEFASGKVSRTDLAVIWPNERIRVRNWAICSLLVFSGIRESELRQCRADDFNSNEATLVIARRPDDPEDPRIREPNAKTSDRIMPLPFFVIERLEDYILGAGSDAATLSGSPFLFLSDGNKSRGQPISSQVVQNAVRQLGQYLGLPNLHPHALRSAWIQNLSDWASANNIDAGELDRFANYLGGWSYFSKSASHYRGDHLTQKAFEAGIIVEQSR